MFCKLSLIEYNQTHLSVNIKLQTKLPPFFIAQNPPYGQYCTFGIEKQILYRFSRKHFVQCDIKNVFASYSKFVSERAGQMFSSILGWGKQLKSKVLMLYNVPIKATSPSTVSNQPISYSVTF